MISHPWWPAHQFKELLSETRWSDCGYGFLLDGARLIFTIQERDRITKFGVAWSDDTAEDQHVKSHPLVVCVLYLSSQRHPVTSIFVSHAQAAEVRSTGRV